jgi:hypothetical protein
MKISDIQVVRGCIAPSPSLSAWVASRCGFSVFCGHDSVVAGFYTKEDALSRPEGLMRQLSMFLVNPKRKLVTCLPDGRRTERHGYDWLIENDQVVREWFSFARCGDTVETMARNELGEWRRAAEAAVALGFISESDKVTIIDMDAVPVSVAEAINDTLHPFTSPGFIDLISGAGNLSRCLHNGSASLHDVICVKRAMEAVFPITGGLFDRTRIPFKSTMASVPRQSVPVLSGFVDEAMAHLGRVSECIGSGHPNRARASFTFFVESLVEMCEALPTETASMAGREGFGRVLSTISGK